MLNELVDGIVRAIREAFPGAAVYDERVAQGLKTPGFSVRVVSATKALFRGRRYRMSCLVNVVYFPPEEGRWRESEDVKERLFGALEYVDVGDGPVRGHGMEGHLQEGVLSFAVTYDGFGYAREDEGDLMRELRLNAAPFVIEKKG